MLISRSICYFILRQHQFCYLDNIITDIFAKYFWAFSSVGLEHYLDRVGGTGSNPVMPTGLYRELMKIIHLFLILTFATTIIGCTKEGTGGKASIQGNVKHHDELIPGATVYIKYGAKELPGTDSSDYDDQTKADSLGAFYKFENLKKGNYFLYATGFDSEESQTVKGGIPVKINESDENVLTDIPVTE